MSLRKLKSHYKNIIYTNENTNGSNFIMYYNLLTVAVSKFLYSLIVFLFNIVLCFFSFSIISLLIHLEFHILRPNSIHLPLLLYLPLSPTAPPPKEKKKQIRKQRAIFFYKTLLWWQFWNSVFCVKSR